MFIGVYNLPNAITLLGLILSLSACFLSYNGQLSLAIICFMYAGVCDMFDGMVARKLPLKDEEKLFGVQLDSIVDVVSFGVAPVMISFHLGFNTTIDYVLSLLYACCATMRLAYFNIHGTSGEGKIKYYTGLPVTFSAIIFPLVYTSTYSNNESFYQMLIRLTFFLVAIMFVLKIKIPKPQGIFYVLSPICALFLTYFWLTH
ncbi:MAG: CDP-alcohol phosphatidyltransferase family protein [Candidatus Sericytochromatia bacterium]